MTGQVGVLAYPRLAAHFGRERSGRAQTAINLLLFASAFAAQALIGAIIDLFPTTADGGYAPDGYQTAFALLLLVQVLAFLWYLRPEPAHDGTRSGQGALATVALGTVIVAASLWLSMMG